MNCSGTQKGKSKTWIISNYSDKGGPDNAHGHHQPLPRLKITMFRKGGTEEANVLRYLFCFLDKKASERMESTCGPIRNMRLIKQLYRIDYTIFWD